MLSNPLDLMTASEYSLAPDILTMFRKLSSAVTSLTSSPVPPLPSDHHAASRAEAYVHLAGLLDHAGVPVDTSDCATCDDPCPPNVGGAGSISESGTIWGGKSYDQYVLDKYGELGELPAGFDTDWESELAGSAKGGRGRAVVVSTGKSDWLRDHTVRI